ncbi:hypothetical protein ACLOJK_010004 [Asimina triloba]
MAKRRPQRPGPSTDRADASAQANAAATHSRISLFFFILFLLVPVVAVAVFRLRSLRADTHAHTDAETFSPSSVHERGLENSKPSKNSSFRHFPNPVLAYVTPCCVHFIHLLEILSLRIEIAGSAMMLGKFNVSHLLSLGLNVGSRDEQHLLLEGLALIPTVTARPNYNVHENAKGYNIAKRFTSKFTHLSPVWYDLKSEGSKLVLEGQHNADIGWISELRMNGNALALEFVKELAQNLHSVGSERNFNLPLQLIYVISPANSANLEEHDFGPEDFQSLHDAVDGFSLMTYDFSGPHRPGPNAPLSWIRSCLQLILGSIDNFALSRAPKIFLGINFYGNDFVLPQGGGAVTGRDYVSLLERHKPVLQWKEEIAEHFFLYSENNIKHAVFYPSLMSIHMRLAEAQAWGVELERHSVEAADN